MEKGLLLINLEVIMKARLFLLVFSFFGLYLLLTPLAWAPPICSQICTINPEGQTICREVCTDNGTAVPEPSSMALIAIGLGGAALMRRFKKK